ncbi:hypothetical protein Dshi_3890 (plasmid) [Dinoroseobacter shibae DFL 12 = DSM 16493]|jgi:hypothetical protein|uniref:Uncharacterized protein n=1 Tax=Dinoroseobacter shibae (strain DSM 16493 / NCIMB 14021 / DFL 12) TaxID=398580 RepID=A8LTQ1_DINSH|nr:MULTISPECIES: hypothetical protein [Dinoroseobacter]ABV95618.1 hypothetical protein Dshi_3890 [Dinoroseobacter shibae DFL 12 = DSM 16493]MDD9718992.1 hypothetical protein [Dinoroseobacter sp. PD6]URF48826.1 hypothetical protein M8008_19960 [Dinoroseobacter shibae]URF53138.1 hypothetical protein M8007_19985 [Dinoroseobacter shibae]
MTTNLFRIATPITLWAIHFIAIYALISAACSPRGLLGPDTMAAVAALVTGTIAVAILVLLILSGRGMRRVGPDGPELPLAQAAWWSALISFLAVLANVWPILRVSGCTG